MFPTPMSLHDALYNIGLVPYQLICALRSGMSYREITDENLLEREQYSMSPRANQISQHIISNDT